MFLSGEFIVEDVIKPTKANGWKNLNIGDVLSVTFEISSCKNSRRGFNSPYVRISYCRKNEFTQPFSCTCGDFIKYSENNIKLKQIK